jgi:hypothetical protein
MPHQSHHTVCPFCTVRLSVFLCSSVLHVCCMVAQTNQHQLSNQTTYCRYQLTLLLPQSILQRLVHSFMAWARVALLCGLKVVSHKSVTRAPALPVLVRPITHLQGLTVISTILNLSVGQSVSKQASIIKHTFLYPTVRPSPRLPSAFSHSIEGEQLIGTRRDSGTRALLFRFGYSRNKNGPDCA